MGPFSLLQPKAFLNVLQSRCHSDSLLEPDEWAFIRSHMTCRAMRLFLSGGIIRTLADLENVRIENVRLIWLDGGVILFHFPK